MLIKVNGHTRFYSHLHDFMKVSQSEYSVYRNSTKYTIYGGKHAGGRRNEWYVQTTEWSAPIYTKSIAESLHLIETM